MPIPTLTVTAVIDILAVAFVIYQLLEIVRGTRAAHILVGILAVVITYEIALRTGLEALRSLLASLAPYTAIAIIVLFQSEIRRTLARLGRKRLFGGYRSPESTAEILLALEFAVPRTHRSADRSRARYRTANVYRKRRPARFADFARSAALDISPGHRAARWRGDHSEGPHRRRGVLSSAQRESGFFDKDRSRASRRYRHHGRDRLPVDYRERRNGD